MSVAVNPMSHGLYGRKDSAVETCRMPSAAEVWDLYSASHSANRCAGVRTLDSAARKGERINKRPPAWSSATDEVFESHRERKEGFILAVLLTGALLAGSAIGGVFSNSEELPVVSQPVAIADSGVAR